MKWAITQPKTQEVLTRLNALRAGRRELLELRLPQIEFSAKGLRTADPEADVAIRGIIAVLAGDRAGLDEAADEYQARFPGEINGAENFVRSYAVVGDGEAVARLAQHAISIAGAEAVAAFLVANMFTCGLFDEIAELVEGLDYDKLPPEDAMSVRRYEDAVARLKRRGVSGGHYREFVQAARAVIADAGWPFPADEFYKEDIGLDEDCPIATIVMTVDATAEELLDLEDRVVDAVSRVGNPIAEEGLLAIQMGFH